MDIRILKNALEHGSTLLGENKKLLPEAYNENKWKEIRESSFYSKIREEIINTGEILLKEPISALTYSKFNYFFETGSRKEYQAEYYERRKRLNTFAILSLIYGDKKYIDALQDAIWVICDEFTWVLPAHTTLQIPENTHREHRQQIDLFASETGFALSEILNLLGDKLSPFIAYRIRKEVKERIIDSFCSPAGLLPWEVNTNNWSAVCLSSVGAAAMYTIDDNNVLAPIIGRLLSAAECFLSGYEEDGCCTEGLGYWNYGFGFLVYFSELLRQRTGGQIDLVGQSTDSSVGLFKYEKLKNIAMFQQKCYLSENKVISFSDGFLTSNFNPGVTCYLKSRFEEVEIPNRKYSAAFNEDNCYRWAHNIRDLVWNESKYEIKNNTEETYFLKDSQWFVSKKAGDQGTICFATKGGHNGESHNHNDVGNFILHINGETLLTDTGCGEYTHQYFGTERYTLLCNSSRGHSLPIVEGHYQKAGVEHCAKSVDASIGKDKDCFSLEISKAYGDENLESLLREFTFIKNTKPMLVLKDTYTFKEKPDSIIERFVTFNKPVFVNEGIVQISTENGSIRIEYDPSCFNCNICHEDFVNHSAVTEKLYMIDLNFTKENLQLLTTAEISFIF